MPLACGDHITKLLLAYNCKQAKRLASFLQHHDLYIILPWRGRGQWHSLLKMIWVSSLGNMPTEEAGVWETCRQKRHQSGKQANRGGIILENMQTEEATCLGNMPAEEVSVQETSQQRRHQSGKHANRRDISPGNKPAEEASVRETNQQRRHQSRKQASRGGISPGNKPAAEASV